MKITKIAKPGKIMGQPPKNPNSGKMDSQIFIGKEDPQHANKKNKVKKKKASIDKDAKIGEFLKGTNSPWERWKNSAKTHEDNAKFVEGMRQMLVSGGEAFLPMTAEYHLIRRMVGNAIQGALKADTEEAYSSAANSLSAALSYAVPMTGEEVRWASTDSKTVKAKHSWPISTHDERGILQRWRSEEIDDRTFVDEILKLSKVSGFPGLSTNAAVRDSIGKILSNYEYSGDFTTAAVLLGTWLEAEKEIEDGGLGEQQVSDV